MRRFILSLLTATARALAIHSTSETFESLARRLELGVPRLVILVLTVIAIELALELAATIRRRRKRTKRKP